MATTNNHIEVIVDGVKRRLQETAPGMYSLLPLRAIDLPADLEDDLDYEDEEGPEGPTDAPWSPVPTGLARQYIEDNPGAKIEIVFPTAWEEDSSSKIKNLGTAEALGVLSHRRMSAQMAKELGFEQYNYDEEMEQIAKDRAPVNPGADFGPPDNEIGDQVVQSMLGPFAKKGGGESPTTQPPRRADLAAPATGEFIRRQGESVQREVEVPKPEPAPAPAPVINVGPFNVTQPSPPDVHVTVEAEKPMTTTKHVQRDAEGHLTSVVVVPHGSDEQINISKIAKRVDHIIEKQADGTFKEISTRVTATHFTDAGIADSNEEREGHTLREAGEPENADDTTVS